VASGVLHNVGNVLTSVNVSTELIAERARNSRSSGIRKLADLLKEHRSDIGRFMAEDPKGQQIPVYLEQLATQLEREKIETLELVMELSRNIGHIKEIVSTQHAFTSAAGTTQVVEIRELFEDALSINRAGLERHGVNVITRCNGAPPITVDRHRVLQILINLISNAKYAFKRTQLGSRKITLSAEKTDEHRMVLQVEDTGAGITEENLTRIFSYGFTTREDGQGFGLHSAALTAKDLGGTLTARSDGPGKGATFVLDLPLAPPDGNDSGKPPGSDG